VLDVLPSPGTAGNGVGLANVFITPFGCGVDNGSMDPELHLLLSFIAGILKSVLIGIVVGVACSLLVCYFSFREPRMTLPADTERR
jgi:hypothetical protein